MTEKTKQCCGCGEEKTKQQIGKGWSTRFPLCYACVPKKERKPLKQKRVRITKNRTPSQQLSVQKDWEIGRQIWAERPHYCIETGEWLGDTLQKIYLSHLLGKGAHPELRHDPRNIVLHSREAHQEWEFGDRRNMKTWKENINWMIANGYVLQTE